MAAELHPESYTGELGPAQLVQYDPTGRDGMVQLAERYNEDDLDIIWEDHSRTATSDPAVASSRMALIYDSGKNQYFLSGDTLYDLTASQREGRLIGVRFRAGVTMPDLRIGQPDAMITGTNEVTNVVIATDRIDAFDPANTHILADAKPKGRNPFAEASQLIRGLRDAPAAAEGYVPTRLRLPRTKDGIIIYSDDTWVDDPNRGGAVWSAQDQADWEQGIIPYPRYLKGRGGAVISPAVQVISPAEAAIRSRLRYAEAESPVEANEDEVLYKPRRGERIAHEIGELATDGYDHLVRLPGFRHFYNKTEDAREARRVAYWRGMPRSRRPAKYKDV